MPGSTQVFFVMNNHVHQHLAGGDGGGDEPRYPWNPKSVHELNAIVSRRRKKPAGSGPFLCPICHRPFNTEKALHGHMRCHPERDWRGMEAPPAGELAADGRRHRYVCDCCKAPFDTRQALGGHRASHSGKKGCSWRSKQQQLALAAEEAIQAVAAAAAAMEAAEAAAAAALSSNAAGEEKQPKHNFDLNDPAPEE